MGVLDSIDKRIENDSKSSVSKTIMANERMLMRNMLKKFDGSVSNHLEEDKEGNYRKFNCKNKNGEDIQYILRYSREDSRKAKSAVFKYGNIEIEDVIGENISSYWLVSDEGKILLGQISDEEIVIPEYGENKPLEVVGSKPVEEIKSTMMEMIEDNIRKHPVLRKYADVILNDVNQIISLDETKDIKPLSKEEVVIASLKSKTEELQEKVKNLEEENTSLQQKNKDLQQENIKQENTIESLIEKIKKVPIFGKKILASLSKTLPEGKEGTDGSSKSTPRNDFKASYEVKDVPGINGIEKKDEKPMSRPDSEIAD